MKFLACLAATALCAAPALAEPGVETIVFVRHGEKPAAGLGQLNCRGLNRALALPSVLGKMFGKPDAILAPSPAVMKEDSGKSYDYVRPLATIEPAAIEFGMPIDATIGFNDVDGLQKALEAPALKDATVFVAWEHKIIDHVAKHVLEAHGGDKHAVPTWPSDDFDSIYVVRIDRRASPETSSFALAKEGLDGRPDACPIPIK